MADFVVRPANMEDQQTIVQFNLQLAAETEDKTLDFDTVQRGVAQIIDDTSKGRYFVATRDGGTSEGIAKDDGLVGSLVGGLAGGQIIGQIMFTYEWSDWRNGDILWIQSVYVHQDYRRQGVFRSLYQAVQDVVDASEDIVGIRLYVEQNNSAAQATYEKLGLSSPGYIVMESLS